MTGLGGGLDEFLPGSVAVVTLLATFNRTLRGLSDGHPPGVHRPHEWNPAKWVKRPV
ncbi:hypothetical protein NQK81_05905 [Amycolatopsis roodepoortensis]|uniref:hypothetical protein n=1 Tax=Amycolatopsis roodepoortensis TaxID=700274 RepID=UPI00214AC8A3|nr:hypothetical protein [Amycolatopsis roodepoortensis]UUV32986.1 hypothetical protein NQK81_05905 [Amycolatopsis roodepoortensis]